MLLRVILSLYLSCAFAAISGLISHLTDWTAIFNFYKTRVVSCVNHCFSTQTRVVKRSRSRLPTLSPLSIRCGREVRETFRWSFTPVVRYPTRRTQTLNINGASHSKRMRNHRARLSQSERANRRVAVKSRVSIDCFAIDRSWFRLSVLVDVLYGVWAIILGYESMGFGALSPCLVFVHAIVSLFEIACAKASDFFVKILIGRVEKPLNKKKKVHPTVNSSRLKRSKKRANEKSKAGVHALFLCVLFLIATASSVEAASENYNLDYGRLALADSSNSPKLSSSLKRRRESRLDPPDADEIGGTDDFTGDEFDDDESSILDEFDEVGFVADSIAVFQLSVENTTPEELHILDGGNQSYFFKEALDAIACAQISIRDKMAFYELLKDALVFAMAKASGRKNIFEKLNGACHVNFPEHFQFEDEENPTDNPTFLIGNFITGHSKLKLDGNMRKIKEKKREDRPWKLESDVWGVACWALGEQKFMESVILVNVCPFTEVYDIGKQLWKNIPQWMQMASEDLLVDQLNHIVEAPSGVGSFGKATGDFLKKYASNKLFPALDKDLVYSDCVHLCCFTQRSMARFRREKDFEAFEALIRVLRGEEGAGEKLKELVRAKITAGFYFEKSEEEIKRMYAKAVATKRERYGPKMERITEKRHATILERYGSFEAYAEKKAATILEKYGGYGPIADKRVATILERYGSFEEIAAKGLATRREVYDLKEIAAKGLATKREVYDLKEIAAKGLATKREVYDLKEIAARILATKRERHDLKEIAAKGRATRLSLYGPTGRTTKTNKPRTKPNKPRTKPDKPRTKPNKPSAPRRTKQYSCVWCTIQITDIFPYYRKDAGGHLCYPCLQKYEYLKTRNSSKIISEQNIINHHHQEQQ